MMRLSASFFHDVVSIMFKGGLIQPPSGPNRVKIDLLNLQEFPEITNWIISVKYYLNEDIGEGDISNDNLGQQELSLNFLYLNF